jgi:hypothetical protein
MSPQELYAAVAKHLEAEAFRVEETRQTRPFTSQERVAFRAGFYRGLQADVARASPDVWERAAAELSRPANTAINGKRSETAA